MQLQTNSLAKRRAASTRNAAIIFLVPAFLFLIIYIAYPIVYSFNLSCYDWNGFASNKVFVGLNNWKELMTDVVFRKAFLNNIIIMVLSIIVQLPIGIALATFLDFGGKKLNIFKVIWFIPMLMSSVAIGYLFKYALDANSGIISGISKLFGGNSIDLLGNPKTALLTITVAICWQFIPFYMVYFLAGYSNIPADLYDDLIYVMTGGGPGNASELMATYMYKNAFLSQRMGYGSAIASGMFIIITIISLITIKALNRKEE